MTNYYDHNLISYLQFLIFSKNVFPDDNLTLVGSSKIKIDFSHKFLPNQFFVFDRLINLKHFHLI